MSKSKVLIVEDEQDYATLLKSFLETFLSKQEYQINLAFDLNEAIGQIDTALPDLVITDLRLDKGLEGLGVFDYLQENNHDIPVIILTAFGDQPNLLKCIPKRPHYLFEKSGEFSRLRQIVSKFAEASKDEVRPNCRRISSLMDKLPKDKHFKLVRDRIEALDIEQYEELEAELPALKQSIQEGGNKKAEITRLDDERKKKGLIPLSYLEKGTIQLSTRHYTSKVKGEKREYHYFYLHWRNIDGKDGCKELGKLEKINDPLVLQKIYAKYPELRAKKLIAGLKQEEK